MLRDRSIHLEATQTSAQLASRVNRDEHASALIEPTAPLDTRRGLPSHARFQTASGQTQEALAIVQRQHHQIAAAI
jgi:hypothetical protein